MAKAICIVKTIVYAGGMDGIEKGFIVFLIMIAISAQAEARVGYDIYATVNDSSAVSSWGRGHHTTEMSFNSVSKCKGDGNSSKYVRINDLSGINLKENIYTKKGRLKEDKSLSISSRVNFVTIEEAVSDKSERYDITINESMPSSLLNVDEIAYRGEGIYKSNSYTNNDDKIATKFHAKKFSESSAFLAVYRNAFILADITPGRVSEFAGENYSTVFQSASDSDLYSGFKFRSSREFIEQDYFGSFKIDRSLSRSHSFQKSNEEDDWLVCCPPGYGSLDYSLQAAWLCLCRSALNDINQGIK